MIRRINKSLLMLSDSFTGFRQYEIDKELKEFYEKEL
jgi:hypothetical protein